MSWHMNEKVMVGVITMLAVNILLSIAQGAYVLKTLDTDPPLIERIIALEFKASEMGKTMDEIKELLKPLNDTMQSIHREQSRRKPMVDYIENRMNGSN